MGAFAKGLTRGEEGVQAAEAVEDPFGLARAYDGVGMLYLRKGDLPKAIPVLERGLDICHATNQPHLVISTAMYLGTAYARSGRMTEALPLLEQATAWAASKKDMLHLAPLLASLSEVYLLAGCMQEATDRALRALDYTSAHKQRGYQAWILRLLGDIAMHRDPPEIEQAQTYYQQALTLANELGMRPLQAHCHRGLGTLYSQTGQSEQARAELSTAIEMYRDMEMTFWLPETEAALVEVESR